MRTVRLVFLAAFTASIVVARSFDPAAQQPASTVDDALLLQPPESVWVSYGRDYAETHHSPLTQIDRANVKRLGLASATEVGSDGKIETTPLVWNGVLYGTSAWSVAYAVDLKTGALKWRWDPALVRGGYPADGPRFCCGAVNRGVAIYRDKVYVGLLDGRLVALNAETGRLAWSVQTTPAGSDYSITGAPRIVKGKVIIGNGGAEYGVRGYVTAYDAETGEKAWRFFTVPGDPSKPFEDAAQERAAKTWTGEWWKYGGGGTPWDGIAYDPEADLLYVGTGNGSPWNRNLRSPKRRRQPLSLLDRRAHARHRRLRLALPDHAGRPLGLQRRAADDARGPDHRRPAAQGDHAGAEERVLLRARSAHRRVHFRRSRSST